MDLDILVPWEHQAETVGTNVLLAETVIVGSVPDTYTYFDTREDMSSTAEDFIMNNAG